MNIKKIENADNHIAPLITDKNKPIKEEIDLFDLYSDVLNNKPQEGLKKEYNLTDYKKIENITYSNKTNCKYNLYLPPDSKAEGLVLYLHGGWFMMGSKDDENEQKYWEYYASKGYAIATIDYPLISENNKNNYSLDKICNEISIGIESINKEAQKQGYNLDNMIVEGFSAGGTLAMIYGAYNSEKSPIPVKCIVNLSGPTNMDPQSFNESMINDGVHSKEEMIAKLATNITGKKITSSSVKNGEYKELTDKLSPTNLFNKINIPVISAYADSNDVYTTNEQLKNYIIKSKINNNNVNFIYKNSNHDLLGSDLNELIDKSILISKN